MEGWLWLVGGLLCVAGQVAFMCWRRRGLGEANWTHLFLASVDGGSQCSGQ
jgi:hypothetical protein